MIVMGLDLSLTSTGMVVVSGRLSVRGDSPPATVVARTLFTTDPDEVDEQRMDRTLTGLLAYVREYDPEVVGIESGVYGHGDSRPHELLGIVKHALWRRRERVATWAPNTVKKFATGNHRASKKEMMEAAEAAGFLLERAARGGYRAGSDDLADAYWVAQKTFSVQ